MTATSCLPVPKTNSVSVLLCFEILELYAEKITLKSSRQNIKNVIIQYQELKKQIKLQCFPLDKLQAESVEWYIKPGSSSRVAAGVMLSTHNSNSLAQVFYSSLIPSFHPLHGTLDREKHCIATCQTMHYCSLLKHLLQFCQHILDFVY